MSKTTKPLLVTFLAAALVAGGGLARADGGSFAGGGVLQDGFEALQRQLAYQDSGVSQHELRLVRDNEPSFGFTPRFAGVPIGLAEGVSIDRGSVLKTRLSGAAAGRQANSQAMRYEQIHDLGIVKVDLLPRVAFVRSGIVVGYPVTPTE